MELGRDVYSDVTVRVKKKQPKWAASFLLFVATILRIVDDIKDFPDVVVIQTVEIGTELQRKLSLHNGLLAHIVADPAGAQVTNVAQHFLLIRRERKVL